MKKGVCEHTHILRALIEYPQGNLEEIHGKTLRSTQEESGGRRNREDLAHARGRYAASRTASANTGEAIRTRGSENVSAQTPLLRGRTYVRTYPRAGRASSYTVPCVVETRAMQG